MRNSIRANYELNGESKSMDFIGDNAEQSMYQWIQEISRENSTFKYLGRADIPEARETVIEIEQPTADNIFIPRADTMPKQTVTLAEVIGAYEPVEEVAEDIATTINLFEEEGFIVKKPKIKVSAFEEWFRTFIDEKDLEEVTYSLIHPAFIDIALTNYDVVEIIIEQANPHEQMKIKDMLVHIDFKNGDVNHFLEHLANGYIQNLGVARD